MGEVPSHAALVWPIAVPLGGAVLAFAVGLRGGRWWGALFGLLTAVAAALLAWAVWEQGELTHALGGWGAPLGIGLRADGLSALLCVSFSVVGASIGLFALGYFAEGPARAYFWPLWLFCLAALNGVLLSADVFNLYVCFELLGLAAVALVTLGEGRRALGAGMRYLLVSLTGSLTFLLGVALLYAAHGVLDLRGLGQVVQGAGPGTLALALMAAGLVAKTALVPLHGWLPAAHASAPAPASAALSALVVKASFYVLLRLHLTFSPGVDTRWMDGLLGGMGAFAVLWASWMALRQPRLKGVVAYSTAAQLGYLFLYFPLARGDHRQAAISGAVMLMVAHAFAKAAAFMAAGSIQRTRGTDEISALRAVGAQLPTSLMAFGVAGVSLMGLPPSGGFVAKWLLLRSAVAQGQWGWALVLLVGGFFAAAYVFRVLALGLLSRPEEQEERRAGLPRRLEVVALGLSLVVLGLGIFADGPLRLLQVGGAP